MRISDQSLSTEYRGCGKAWAAIVTGIAIERAKLSPFPKAAEDFYLNGKEAKAPNDEGSRAGDGILLRWLDELGCLKCGARDDGRWTLGRQAPASSFNVDFLGSNQNLSIRNGIGYLYTHYCEGAQQ